MNFWLNGPKLFVYWRRAPGEKGEAFLPRSLDPKAQCNCTDWHGPAWAVPCRAVGLSLGQGPGLFWVGPYRAIGPKERGPARPGSSPWAAWPILHLYIYPPTHVIPGSRRIVSTIWFNEVEAKFIFEYQSSKKNLLA